MKHNQKNSLLDNIRKMPIVETACRQSGISRATFYRWRKEDPKFNKFVDEALREGTMLVNDMAEVNLISAIKDRNISAITYWLKHHHPTYATRVEVMAHINSFNQELTPEQKAVIEEALKLASGSANDSSKDNDSN